MNTIFIETNKKKSRIPLISRKPIKVMSVYGSAPKEKLTQKHYLSDAYINFQKMKDPILQNLLAGDSSKYTTYQMFVTVMFRLARDTKRVKKYAPYVKEIDIPLLLLTRKNGQPVTLQYLSDSKIWGITEGDSIVMHFNPTTITGILEFLNGFESDHVKKQCMLNVSEFRILFDTHMIDPAAGQLKNKETGNTEETNAA